jgi:hypothetical protein
MRARTFPSIFFFLLTSACGARSEIGGALPDASVVDVSSDEAASQTSCQKGVVEIAKTGSHPDTIVLDGAWVYWHDEGGVFRAKKTGSAPETLAQTTSKLWPDLAAFAVGDGHLFYGDGDAIVFDGKTIDTLASPGFAASSSHVYAWSRDLLPTPLFRFAFDGTGGWNNEYITHKPVEMTFAPPEIPCIAEDPGVECAGQLLSGLGATDLVATQTDVWLTSNDATNGARVMHIELPSLKTTPLDGTIGALAIAADDSDLFFTDATNRRVRRIEGKAGAVTDIALAGDGFGPIDLVVDDTCVYWTNGTVVPDGQGAVMAAPKK